MRARRQALPDTVARRCAMEMARHARHHPLLLNSTRIACYLAADGEMDPAPLVEHLWSLGKQLFLPVLVPFARQRLWFARFQPGDRLVINRFGIPEPERRRLIKPAALDLVITPLVAFDERGYRIGMGGGFYDRCFGFLRRRTYWHKPRLLGLAYEFQKQVAIEANAWDIPLDAIATEVTLYLAGKQAV